MRDSKRGIQLEIFNCYRYCLVVYEGKGRSADGRANGSVEENEMHTRLHVHRLVYGERARGVVSRNPRLENVKETYSTTYPAHEGVPYPSPGRRPVRVSERLNSRFCVREATIIARRTLKNFPCGSRGPICSVNRREFIWKVHSVTLYLECDQLTVVNALTNSVSQTALCVYY